MAVEVDSSPGQKRSRTRSPAYPYIALPNALEKAAVLWQVEGRHAAAVNVAMQHWGYKEDSSTGYSCVAALKKFGLVDHEGMGDTRQVKLSDLALTILLDQDPDSDERRGALRAAALGPRIHTELWERYGTELPSDQSLKRYLVLERGFNEASVDELLDEYKQTMTFAGLNVATGAGGVAAARPPLGAAPAPAMTGAAPGHGLTLAPPSSGRGTTGAGSEPGAALGSANGPGRPNPFHPATDAAPPVERRTEGSSAPPRPSNPRQDAPPPAPPMRPVPDASRRAAAGSGQQPGLFDEDATDHEPAAESSSSVARPAHPGSTREGTPWSMARKELPVPLDNDLVARVPYPMSEEDFDLLIDTLQLWKKRLVQPGM